MRKHYIFLEVFIMSEHEKNLRQVLGLIKSSVRKMNHLWEGATGSDHTWLCDAYGDAIKAWELLEKEVFRLEEIQIQEPWIVNLYTCEEES
jgi:hypothetical protein